MLEASSPYFRGLRDKLRDLEIIDDFTLRVVFHKPFAPFLDVLATSPVAVVTREGITEPEAPAEQLIGSGPFRLVNYAPDELVILERNAGYYRQGVPYLDYIFIHVMQDRSTRRAAFFTSQVDLFGLLDVDELDASEREEMVSRDINAVLFDGPSVVKALWFDTQSPLFTDARVRRAVAMALDRRALGEKLYQDRAIAQGPVPSLLCPNWALPGQFLEDVLPYATQRRPSNCWQRPVIQTASSLLSTCPAGKTTS